MNTTDNLPKKLKKEPLIDAVFEIRFKSEASAADVLPGYLFSTLEGDKKIERMGVADLPKAMRDADPNLQFSPLVKLTWGNFFIVIGDNSLGIACRYPYPGWGYFKPAIIEIIEAINKIEVISIIERYSMKYIDLIPSNNIKKQISSINIDVSLGGYKLENSNFSLRMDISDKENNLLHVVNVISSARTKLVDGSEKEGIIIDVDTISFSENESLSDWTEKMPNILDKLHSENKKIFFKCLHKNALEKLEPEYD